MGDTNILPARVQNVLDMEIIRLNLWSIKFNSSNIKLEGFVKNEDGTAMQKVCSEIICKRMNSVMLFDVSGRFFELVGQIDREYQQKMGMPSRIVDEFLNGFPENWPYLIKSCISVDSRSSLRPIQAAPREPLRSRAEPIITLADETEVVVGDNKNSDTGNGRKHREQVERNSNDQVQMPREANMKNNIQEEEDDIANYTMRAPVSQNGEAITPIRFTRGNGKKGANTRSIFESTPARGTSSGPLQSSIASVPPPQQSRRLSTNQNSQLQSQCQKIQVAPSQNEKPPFREPQFSNDTDLFAVPRLQENKNNRLPSLSAASSDGAHDFFDEMDTLFDTANIEHTPARDRNIIRRSRVASPSPPLRRYRTSSRDCERDIYEPTRHSNRSDNGFNINRNRSDAFRKNEGRNDGSRMSRKRGYFYSPDKYRDNFSRRIKNIDYEQMHDNKHSRERENSPYSGRSIQFEDVYRKRNYGDYDDFRKRSRDEEEDRKLNEILRREKEMMARLQQHRKSVSSFPKSYLSDDDEFDMADQWERENQELLENSMMFGDGLPKKRKMSRDCKSERLKNPKESVKKPVQSQKSNRVKRLETDNANDSIALSRPRRLCATPSTPAPKKIVWPKRDLDRLKRIIELKKPTAANADWAEVARLLAKDGVELEAAKQTAITKLKWKEAVQNEELLNCEEEDKKRRRGLAARVKEGVKMHEEIREGGENKGGDLQNGVESMEEYRPEDMAADQSLLAQKTPIVVKRKGGTRASILPKPVEDSPLARGSNSALNSPKLDQTKAKEVETTLKYVHHLSQLHANPTCRGNKSFANKSLPGGRKNTSMSLEQGTRKAMKIINRGQTFYEDEEDEDDECSENDEDTSMY